MKKIFALMVMVMCFIQFSQAGDTVTRDVNKLPVAAREMISKHFPQAKVSYIKIEKDLFLSTSYDVKMSDGIELEFNSKGEWLEIDCKDKAVPAVFIPQTISKYMQSNYNGHKIVKIERNRKGYELSLENGLEVDFDQFGGFLKLSD
ncbi:PepSY-like domain-containing protein [Phocaeicola sp.]